MTTGSVEGPPPQTYSSPPVTVILTVVLLVFFFVGFFAIYFCRCFLENLLYSWYLRHSPSGTPVCANAGQGIDPSIIDTFPSFTYSSVKDLRKEKYGLECAICLAEFQNDDMLRLLTGCCHVFHQECIDLWLESHKTCPVCRRSLDTPYQSPERPVINQTTDEPPVENSISISIRQDEEECGGGGGGEAGGSGQRAEGEGEGEGRDDEEVEKFSRSHSTGHSIVRTRRDEDRYTLKLPEHVQAKLFRGRNWTKSCTTFGEFKSKPTAGNRAFAEVSGTTSGGDVMNRV